MVKESVDGPSGINELLSLEQLLKEGNVGLEGSYHPCAHV